jgi:hypothetical protein
MRKLTAFAALLLMSRGLMAADTVLYVFGGDGHKTFLGCLSCDSSHAKSVWNELSYFGFRNGLGVWNEFSEFVSASSTHSMCNEFATDPPVIVDDQGKVQGRVSINEFAPGSICGATGDEQLCEEVHTLCESRN